MIQQTTASSTGAITLTYEHITAEGMFSYAWLGFNTVPTSIGNITITFIDNDTDQRIPLETHDPTADSELGYILLPNADFPLSKGDKIEIAYTNPDSRTVTAGIKVLDRLR